MGGDIEEYPFIFMNTPASLQILASVEMALMVWRCEYANTGHLYVKPSTFFIEQKFSCKEVLVDPVPHRIAAQIDEKTASIGRHLRKWIDFHSDRDFIDADSTEVFRKCFKHIVADFSGSIGCKTSAINMLNSGEFSDVVNCKIACTYCLEDQVKRFWPSVASIANESGTYVNSTHDKCNLSYWNGWMKSGGNVIVDTESVERPMKNAAFRRNDATAFDYFCKMLPDHESVSKFISLLSRTDNRYHPAVVHSLLLRTLDRVKAEEIFKKAAVSSIFTVLTKNDKNFGYAHQLWTLMGHSILENKSQFYNVVFELWMLVSPNHSHDLSYSQYGQANNLLLEIWSHASDEWKAYVSNNFLRNNFLYIYNVPNEFCKHIRYGHDMTFFLEITSQLRGEDKERLWQKNWRGFALCSKFMYLEQFMRICLPNEDAIELFKNKLTNFKCLFRLLIEKGFYSDLKDYVMLCSKDTIQRQRLGKKVLESNLDVIFLHDDEKFAKFEWFVSEVFANVQKDIDEFKSQMISSAKCVKNLFVALQADKIRVKDFSRIIRRFVNDEAELQQVKRKFFEHCCTYPVDYEWSSHPMLNADQWQEFLVWCTAHLEEISTFKRSLNVDVIFLERVRHFLHGECYVEVLNFLDGFLNWYFGNGEDAKNFKLEKVKNYKQIDILRVEMEKKCIFYRDEMYTLLMWLCDGNLKNVVEFCNSCNCPLRRWNSTYNS